MDNAVSIERRLKAMRQTQTPDGKEHYEIEECIQYGTLAVVFPANAPKWTLVLNKDYTFSTDEDVEKAGGTLSLCRINIADKR